MTAQSLPNSVANLVKPTRYVSTTDTAKLIRQALKEAFPEIQFSVKSKKYSGGSSITVKWVDGPTSKQVEAIAKVFQGSYFDGMTDYKGGYTSTLDGEPVKFCADFVFTSRDMSPRAQVNMLTALGRLTAEEREALLCRLGLANYYQGKQSPEQLVWAVWANMPAPAFEGRTSKLAESVNVIDSY